MHLTLYQASGGSVVRLHRERENNVTAAACMTVLFVHRQLRLVCCCSSSSWGSFAIPRTPCIRVQTKAGFLCAMRRVYRMMPGCQFTFCSLRQRQKAHDRSSRLTTALRKAESGAVGVLKKNKFNFRPSSFHSVYWATHNDTPTPGVGA